MKYPIEIKTLDLGRVAYIRSFDSYADDRSLKAFERLKLWADKNSYYRKNSCFFGMSVDDPEVTPKENCHYESCLSVSSEAKSEGEIQVIDFPKLQYATTRISGGFETCAEACQEENFYSY